MTGVVSNLLPGKGYGFITGDNGQEYFFHSTETEGWNEIVRAFTNLGGGKLKVTFVPQKSNKGPRATNVTLL